MVVGGDEPRGAMARAAQFSIQLLLVAAAIALLGFVVVQLRLVVVPVLTALFVATVLLPPVEWLRRRGWRPALATLTVMVLAAALVGGATALIAPSVADELGDLGTSVREGFEEVGTSLAEGPLGITETDINEAIDSSVETLRNNTGAIGQGIATAAITIGELLAGLLLMIVVLFFFLKDGDRIWSFLVDLLPLHRRADANEIGVRAWATLSGYLKGLATVALIDAVLIGAGLAILGVPLVLPLAVLTFVAAFFPLVGAVTAGLVAALVALVSNGVVAALIVVALIIAVQQIEGDVIYPYVVGRAIRLHPVAILLVLTAGAVVAGIAGALFAVPIAAVLWTAFSYLRREGGEDGASAPDGATGSMAGDPAGSHS